MAAGDPPVLPVFLVTLAVFLILSFITFSMPFVSSLYVFHTSKAGGVRFGLWGWCLDTDGTCSHPLRLGYTWEPEVTLPLMDAVVFYPIAAILCLFALVTLGYTMYYRTVKADKMFSWLILSAFVASTVAFVFMITLWSVAQVRFQSGGYQARFGAIPWMSLGASLTLLILSLHSGCGSLSRLRRGPYPTRPYRY